MKVAASLPPASIRTGHWLLLFSPALLWSGLEISETFFTAEKFPLLGAIVAVALFSLQGFFCLAFLKRFRKTPLTGSGLLFIPVVNSLYPAIQKNNSGSERLFGFSFFVCQLVYLVPSKILSAVFSQPGISPLAAEWLTAFIRIGSFAFFALAWAKLFSEMLIGNYGGIFRQKEISLDHFRMHHFNVTKKSGYRNSFFIRIVFILSVVFTMSISLLKNDIAGSWLQHAAFAVLLTGLFSYAFIVYAFFQPAFNLDYRHFHYEGIYAFGFLIPVYNLYWAVSTPFRLRKFMWSGFGNFKLERSFVIPSWLLFSWGAAALLWLAHNSLHLFTGIFIYLVDPLFKPAYSSPEHLYPFIIFLLLPVMILLSAIERAGAKQIREMKNVAELEKQEAA